MTEHVHDWEWHSVNGDFYCVRCPERMSVWQALLRINATEMLSAGFAADSAGIIEGLAPVLDMKDEMLKRSNALKAYADTLEGKDG